MSTTIPHEQLVTIDLVRQHLALQLELQLKAAKQAFMDTHKLSAITDTVSSLTQLLAVLDNMNL